MQIAGRFAGSIDRIRDLLKGKEEVLLTACFILFFMPYDGSLPRPIYLAWKAAVSVISMASIIIVLVDGKQSRRWIVLSSFFFVYYLASSLAARTSFPLVLNSFLMLYGVGFITVLELGLQFDYRRCLRAFLFGSSVMCFVHYLTFLLSPEAIGGLFGGGLRLYSGEGKENWYLLTYDNATIYYIIPPLTIGLHYVFAFCKQHFWKVLLCELLFLLMFINNRSLVAMATMVLLAAASLAVYVLQRLSNKPRCVNAKIGFRVANALGLLISAAIVWLVTSGLLGGLSAGMGRNSTFHGRTGIWRKAIGLFLQSPLLGNGREYASLTIEKIGQSHVHNIILQFLYTGGIVALALFVIGIYLYSPKSELSDTGVQFPLLMGILLFFFAASFDWVPTNPIPFALFVVPFYSVDGAALTDPAEVGHGPAKQGYVPMHLKKG